MSPASPALAGGFVTTTVPGKPVVNFPHCFVFFFFSKGLFTFGDGTIIFLLKETAEWIRTLTSV